MKLLIVICWSFALPALVADPAPPVAPLPEDDPTGAALEVPTLPECSVEDGFVPQADKDRVNLLMSSVPSGLANGTLTQAQVPGVYANIRTLIATLRGRHVVDPWVETKDVEVLKLLADASDSLLGGYYLALRCQCLNRASFKFMWVAVQMFDAQALTMVAETILELGDTYAAFFVARMQEAIILSASGDQISSAQRLREAVLTLPWPAYTYNRVATWPDYETTVGARLVGWAVVRSSWGY